MTAQGAAAAADKEAALLALCARQLHGGRCIVFFRTKQRAHRARMLFGLAGLPHATELHGNMTQAARLESLERFRTVGALASTPFPSDLRVPSLCMFLAPSRIPVLLQ